MFLWLAAACHNGLVIKQRQLDTGLVNPELIKAQQDLASLELAITGQLDAEAMLLSVSSNGGWPIRLGEERTIFACLGANGDWKWAGENSNWVTEQMEQYGALWVYETTIAEPNESAYHFHNGTTAIPDPYGRYYTIDQGEERSLVRSELAHYERWFNVDGRVVDVWVPTHEASHRITVFSSEATLDPGWNLAQLAQPTTMIVAVKPTITDVVDYTHTTDAVDGQSVGGNADAFLERWVEFESFLDAHYGEPQVEGILGTGLGANFALYSVYRYPNAYDLTISLSGSFYWGTTAENNSSINNIYHDSAVMAGNRFFLDSGGSIDTTAGERCADLDNDGNWDDIANDDNYCSTWQLNQTILDKGGIYGQSLWYRNDVLITAAVPMWEQRVIEPMAIFQALP